MVMPALDGPVLARRMMRDRPSLRVVFITGYALEAIEHPGDLAHDGALLEKPFTADQLARTVREALAAAS
jgi:FixJ family two-component response regulator